MNDLQTLRAALTTDEPDQDVADRSRHRLQNRINGGAARKKRPGWLTIGSGLTVAVAAAAVAIAVIPGAPVETPPVTTVSGADILLAAATAAEQTPTTSGTYWHFKVDQKGGSHPAVYEYWIKPDGQLWFKGEKTQGQVMPMGPLETAFSMGFVDVTLDQLLALPTDPVALKAWLVDALENSDARTSAGPLTADDREQGMYWCLSSLVSTLPAPPEVRAAAFRALAASPGVENLGEVPGGQGLSLPSGDRLVVDPATGRVNETSVYVNMDGGIHGAGDSGSTFSITAEWTDTLPA